MDIIIFFEAMGNLFLAAILFLAIIMTSMLSIVFYLMKGLTPSVLNGKQYLINKAMKNKWRLHGRRARQVYSQNG